MLTPEQFDDVKARLANGSGNHGEIARDLGISRRTVVRIAVGQMERPRRKGEYECSGCGLLVNIKPCRICATRKYILKRRILDARAKKIREGKCAGPTE